MGKTKNLATTGPGSFRIGKRLIWSMRTLSTMTCAMVIGYVTYYGTNVLGIPAGTIGLLILASKLVDAVSDLVGGWLVDRTNTKLGKARPYELSIIGVWASTVLIKLALTSNKYIYLYALLILVVNFLSGFTSSNTYYFDYIVGDVSLMGIASLPAMITPILLLFFPLLLKKHSVVGVSKVCLIFGIFGCVLKQFAGANLGMIVLGNLIGGIGTLPLSAFLVILLADTMDYNEWKTGQRVEGVYSSIGSFGQKIGTGLAAVLSGFLLEAAGFISSEIRVEQPESAINMVRAQFGIIPGIFMAVALVVLLFFDVEKKMPQIQKELAERKGQTNTEVQA